MAAERDDEPAQPDCLGVRDGDEAQHHRVEHRPLLEQQSGHGRQHHQRPRPAAAFLQGGAAGPRWRGRGRCETGRYWIATAHHWTGHSASGQNKYVDSTGSRHHDPGSRRQSTSQARADATSCSITISTTATVQSRGAKCVCNQARRNPPGTDGRVVLHQQVQRHGSAAEGEHQEVVLREVAAPEEHSPPSEMPGHQGQRDRAGGRPPRPEGLGRCGPDGAFEPRQPPSERDVALVRSTAAASPRPTPASTSHQVGGRPTAFLLARHDRGGQRRSRHQHAPTRRVTEPPATEISRQHPGRERRTPQGDREGQEPAGATPGPPARGHQRSGATQRRGTPLAAPRQDGGHQEQERQQAPECQPGLVQAVRGEVERHPAAVALRDQVALHPAVDSHRRQLVVLRAWPANRR